LCPPGSAVKGTVLRRVLLHQTGGEVRLWSGSLFFNSSKLYYVQSFSLARADGHRPLYVGSDNQRGVELACRLQCRQHEQPLRIYDR